MRPILTPNQMRELDRRTIEDLGLPGIVLMELAARGVMLEVENFVRGHYFGVHTLVFCGPGNNGGDGFAVARRLLNHGANPKVYLCCPRDKVKGDAETNLKVYENLGGTVIEVSSTDQLKALPSADLIIDALLGTGISGAPHGLIKDAIQAINSHSAPVIAVDIPSGVNGATGDTPGVAVRADVTPTFGELKIGHIIPPGLELAGRLSRVDIQIPEQFVDETPVQLYLAEPDDIYGMLPHRGRSAHKGDAGKVLMIAGSVGMTGAAELAGRACLRSGAGLVKVATAKNAQAILAGRMAEIMTIPVEDNENGAITPGAETTIKDAQQWADIEVIGPGLSLNKDTVSWFKEHVKNLPLPTVIDADGLNALSQHPELLENLNPDVVLTPHLGEFARLTGLSSNEIAKDRVFVAREFAMKYNVTLLLKGVPTLIADARGTVIAVLTGNPGMATAGMGDVLTGVVAGMMAQGLTAAQAAIVATSIHGLAGNLAAREIGSTGIVASDVVEHLPLAQDMMAGINQPTHHHDGCGCGGHGDGHGGGGGCGCGGGDDCNCDGDCNCEGDCGDDGGCGCGGH